MEIFLDTEAHLNIQKGSLNESVLTQTGGVDHLIEMYLNRDVFYQQEQQRISEISDQSLVKNDSKTLTPQPQTEDSISITKNTKKHKKSIFHNFQKHLISTIKKYMNFNKTRFSHLPEADLAFQLWQGFIKTSSFNKRLLHMVFGVETDDLNQTGIERVSTEFSEFSKIHESFGDQMILRAQKIIRSYVVEESHHISKAFLRSNSNITKFQEFYGYYIQFINEIECGPMPKRMKKTSKQTLIDNLKSKRSSK